MTQPQYAWEGMPLCEHGIQFDCEQCKIVRGEIGGEEWTLPGRRRKSLFQRGDFNLHSGVKSWLKIDCDALTIEDLDTLAYLLLFRLPDFGAVEGVPRGGLGLAMALEPYASEGPLLIVDDVLTSGGSIEEHRAGRDAIGAVIFARRQPPAWVTPLFVLTPSFKLEQDDGGNPIP